MSTYSSNKNLYRIFQITCLIVICLFLYALCGCRYDAIEGMTTTTENNDNIKSNSDKLRCPDMLIQKGSQVFLYNSKLKEVPGVNPVQFNNLEEYSNFLDWQKSQGIICPVLYLQKTFNTQGEEFYKSRPSVSEPQYGLPDEDEANVTDGAYFLSADGETLFESHLGKDNAFAYPYSRDVENKTVCDVVATDIKGKSASAMDTNWGGSAFANELIKSGYYNANFITT